MGKRSKQAKCGYCGKQAKATRDHVVPKCLFPFGVPNDVVTVSACRNCNEQKSKADNWLRDYLTMDIVGQETWQGKHLLYGSIAGDLRRDRSGSVMRAIRSGRSELRNSIDEDSIQRFRDEIFNSGGDTEVVVVQTNSYRTTEAIAWICKGLFFHVRGTPLAIARFRADRYMPKQFSMLEELLSSAPGLGYGSIGGEEFSCFYAFDNKDDSRAVMLLLFWGCIPFLCTINLDDDPEVPEGVFSFSP